jgi:hypothetical protein
MKIFNIIFFFLFIVFAALQYNDPDPYIWMPIYLFGAYLCFRTIQKKYNPVLYIMGFAAYTLYGLYLFFDKTGVIDWMREHHAENIAETMKAETPWVEETREFFGLVILIVVLIINMLWLKRNRAVSASL